MTDNYPKPHLMGYAEAYHTAPEHLRDKMVRYDVRCRGRLERRRNESHAEYFRRWLSERWAVIFDVKDQVYGNYLVIPDSSNLCDN